MSSSSREAGLQASKRRYKVLKRCDQNDPEIRKEISQLEADFPELLGLPPPTLSKETRATLEGGALVTSIEEGTNANGDGAAPIPDEQQQKEAELKRKFAEVQESLMKNSANNNNNTNHTQEKKNEEKITEPDEVKKQFSELHSIVKNMEEHEKEKSSRTAVASSSSTLQDNKNYLQGAFLALQAYDAFCISTFPTQRIPSSAEALTAVVSGGLTTFLQFVLLGKMSLESPGLCSNDAMTLNPVLWASGAVMVRLFSSDLPSCFGNNNGNSQKNGQPQQQRRTFMGALPYIGATVAAAVVRLVLVSIVSFTVYSILFVVLQTLISEANRHQHPGEAGIGVPKRFCA